MKKLLLTASVAAFILASCTDDFQAPNSNNVEGKVTLKATYPVGDELETRTTISSGDISWSDGDAIGLFNAVTTGDVTNAQFSYNGTDFKGDIDVFMGSEYYGYYPYNQLAQLQKDGVMNLYINQYQNYNWEEATPYDATTFWKTTTGSFASGAAPSVGVGSLVNTDTENPTINMTMKGVAGYVVFTVQGFGSDIKTATLTVTNPGDTYKVTEGKIQLAGELKVTVPTFTANTVKGDVNGIEVVSGNDFASNEITLNFGKNGAPLSVDTPVNLWFVVNPMTPFAGSTFTLVFNDDEANPVTKTITTPGAPQYVGANMIRRMANTADPKNPAPFLYAGDYCILPNALAFLEYANLVTNGLSAEQIGYWNASKNKTVQTDYDETNVSYLTTILKSSAFDEATGDLQTTVATSLYDYIKPALITGTIDLTNLLKELQTAVGSESPVIILSSYFDYIRDYFDNGFNGPIGGEIAYTLQGASAKATINGLNVNGDGLFIGTGGVQNTTSDGGKYTFVDGITLTNVTVNAVTEDTNYFLAVTDAAPVTKGIQAISNITIGTGCSLNYKGTTVKNPALFQDIYATDIAQNKKLLNDVPETGISYYATNFNVTSTFSGAFNFVDNKVPVSAFEHAIINDTKYNPILIVQNGTDAGALLNKVAANPTDFSLTDYTKSTSYWTGTSYETSADGNFYAENLAYYSRQNVTGLQPVTMTMDINLMGGVNADLQYGFKNPLTWYSLNGKSQSGYQVNGKGTDGTQYTISNVYIDGTDGNNNKIENDYLTLFGFGSVANSVQVNYITIENTLKNPNAVIAAISQVPATTGGKSLAMVNNLTINVNDAVATFTDNNMSQAAFGGLYANLRRVNMLPLVDQNSKVVMTAQPTIPKGAVFGEIAGLVAIQPSTNDNGSLLVANTFGVNAFGLANVIVNPATATGTVLSLTGFKTTPAAEKDSYQIGNVLLTCNGSAGSYAENMLNVSYQGFTTPSNGLFQFILQSNGQYTWNGKYTVDQSIIDQVK